MRRFFASNADFSKPVVFIADPKEVHHLLNVLRHKISDHVILFNGRGEEAEAEITSIRKSDVELKVVKKQKFEASLPPIILACAIPKKSKFETIIEKATELGVAEIIPLRTQRTEAFPKGEDRLAQKMARYQQVALNAAKQSQRQTVPMIHTVVKFADALQMLKKSSTMLIPSLLEKHQPILSAMEKMPQGRAIAVFIGPEGDFTPAEYKSAFDAGCLPVSLGETVLKVETAALCAVCCVTQYFYHARTSC